MQSTEIVCHLKLVVKFVAECIALVAISVVGLVIARRIRWDLFGWVFVAGMLGVLAGAPVVFLGWLISRSDWLHHNGRILWIGIGLFAGGLLLVQFGLFFYVPQPNEQNKEPAEQAERRNHKQAG